MASTINATSTSNGGLISTGDDSGVLNIQTNETTAVTIDASQDVTVANDVFVVGRVGVGTSSPATALQVSGQAATPSGLANRSAYFAVATSNTNDAGVVLGSINGNTPYVAASKLGNGGATALSFYTNDTERMRLGSSSGNLGVGGLYDSSSRLAVVKNGQGDWNNRSLTVEDNTGGSSQPGIGFHAAGNGTASIFKMWGASSNFECRNGDDSGFRAILASAFTVSSDYRIKTDVVEVGSVLPNVMALRPVNYEKDGVNGREYGLIAHEAAEHFPELVQGEKDAMRSDGSMDLQTVNYMSLTSILVKAIQEQQALITTLTERITALEAK